jgi:hypothetical protein
MQDDQIEKVIDARVQRRLASDHDYLYAENAEQQTRAERKVELIEEARTLRELLTSGSIAADRIATLDDRIEEINDELLALLREQMTKSEHERVSDCTLVYEGHVAAPGYGVSYRCDECGRPWLRIGTAYHDPREQLFELRPEDVI